MILTFEIGTDVSGWVRTSDVIPLPPFLVLVQVQEETVLIPAAIGLALSPVGVLPGCPIQPFPDVLHFLICSTQVGRPLRLPI